MSSPSDSYRPPRNPHRLSTSNANNDSLLPDDILEASLLNNRNSFFQTFRSQFSSINDIESEIDDDFEEQSDSELLIESRNSNKNIVWYKRPSLYMVSVFVFMFAFSDGISITSELQLIIKAICFSTNNGELRDCSSAIVQQQNADLQKWMNFTSGLCKTMVSIKLGTLSDLYGRKPIMIYTLSCTLLTKFLKMFILNTEIIEFKSWLLILINLIDAVGGSVFVFLGVANSYLIDVIGESKRTQSLGIIVAFLYFGLGFGPMFGSFLPFEPLRILRISFIGLCLTLLLAVFVFPESRSIKLRNKTRRLSTISVELSKSDNQKNESTFASTFKFLSSLKLLWISRYNEDGSLNNTARNNTLTLISIDIMVSSCTVGLAMCIILYSTFKFNWDASDLGLFIGFTMLMKSLVLLVFNPWLNNKLNQRYQSKPNEIDLIDYISLILCTTMELIGGIILTFSNNSIVFLSSCFFSAFGSLSTPVLHSTILKYNDNPDKNGEFFGCLALIRNLINLIAPLASLTIYSSTLSYNPRIIFYIMIILLTGAFTLSCLVKVAK